ncbi:MAG: permease prefix domain 1-containing protein [Gemmatimonadota bacterium]
MDPNRIGDPTKESLESQIDAWRRHLRRSRAFTGRDVEELEDHLREQIASLQADGLSEDEAFLVAVKRLGSVDALTREFAREHSERLWKQLVLAGDSERGGEVGGEGSRRMWVALALAVAAAVAIKLPALFGIDFESESAAFFYPLNIGFLTLPFVVAYFAWERPLATSSRLWLAGAFALAALVVNLFPFPSWAPGVRVPDTLALTALHLPIVLWLGVGVAYVGGGGAGASGGWTSSGSPASSSYTSS